jgi:hypothetical protein
MKADDAPQLPDVEALTRAYLTGQERSVDAQRMLDAVRLAVAGATPMDRVASVRAVRWARARWSVGLAAATGSLLVLIWILREPTARADAVQFVREARGALRPSIDRSYRVHIELAPGAAERFPVLAMLAPLDSPLWTRADRFWISAAQPDRTWSCGRDEQRRLWIAPTSDVGLVFEPDEIPEPFALAIEMCTMELDRILGAMLTESDMTAIRQGESLSQETVRVRGTLRRNDSDSDLRSVVVDIDTRTKLVSRVVVERSWHGIPAAQVAFTFEHAGVQSESRYRLAGHLGPDAATYGPDQRIRRRRQLIRFFGSLFLNGGSSEQPSPG